jgi:hypothetical protein
MSKLAILFERASWLFKEMFAHLSFKFLLELVQIVRAHLSFLLSLLKLFQNFMRRIVKVARTSVAVGTFSRVTTFSRTMMTFKVTGRSTLLQWSFSVHISKCTCGSSGICFFVLWLLSFSRSCESRLFRGDNLGLSGSVHLDSVKEFLKYL